MALAIGNPTSLQVQPITKLKPKHIPPGISLLAGGIAGGVEAAITYPFEFAKTRAQLKSHGLSSSNPFTMLRYVAANEGFSAIYAGCWTLIAGTALKAGIRFLSFDAIKNALADEQGRLTPIRGIAAGMAAGCTESITVVTPTERIKTALVDDTRGQRRFRGGGHAFTVILKESGLQGVYRGVVSTCIKQSATSAVRMGTYEVLKNVVSNRKIKTTPYLTFGMGAVAGVVTVYVTQPLDTVKTRIQSAKGATLSEAVRSILSEHGTRGLWRGSTMRLGRLVFSGGIVFTIYEQIVSMTKPILA
ncbi:hypothetical protein LTS08_003441 [Lithohypha guttulata]|nr:hypothetical protein LTS08_003441 [Lithohypha guttulata]